MKTEETLKLIEKEIDDRVREFARKRKNDRLWAFGLKITAVLLAAVITVLLGLKVEAGWSEIFRNIALAFGALITFLNAYEAFFDHRSLWVRRTVTLIHLYKLQRDFRFYKSGTEPGEVNSAALEKFKDRLDEIMENDLRNWLKLRGADEDQAQLEAQAPSDPPKAKGSP